MIEPQADWFALRPVLWVNTLDADARLKDIAKSTRDFTESDGTHRFEATHSRPRFPLQRVSARVAASAGVAAGQKFSVSISACVAGL